MDGSASTDNHRLLRYAWDFGDGTRAIGPAPIVNKSWTAAGEYTVTLVVSDAAGNSAADTAIVRVEAVAPPMVQILSPGPAQILSSSDVTVGWSLVPGTDPLDRVELRLDAGPAVVLAPAEVSYRFVSVPDGGHEINITAYDLSGQSGSARVSFIVDTTRPSVSISEPRPGVLVALSDVLVRWSISDAGSGIERVELQSDVNPVVVLDAAVSSQVLVGLADGSHIVSVTGIDRAGNREGASVNFTVDTVPPSVTILSPIEGSLVGLGSPLEIVWVAFDATSGIDRFEVIIDGGAPIVVSSAQRSYALGGMADGVHEVRVRAIDLAGHPSESRTSFALDTMPPFLSILSPGPGARMVGENVEVKWSSFDETSGLARIEVNLDNGSWVVLPGSATSYTFAGLSPGDHQVQVAAFDRAGNVRLVAVEFRLLASGPSSTLPFDLLIALSLTALTGIAAIAIVWLLRRRNQRPRRPSP